MQGELPRIEERSSGYGLCKLPDFQLRWVLLQAGKPLIETLQTLMS